MSRAISLDKKSKKLLDSANKAYSKNNIREAQKYARKIAASRHIPAEPMIKVAAAAANAKDFDLAEKLCTRIFASAPLEDTTMANLNLILGAIFTGTERPGLAEEAYEKAIRFAPGNPAPLNYLGAVQSFTGQHERALETLQKAYSLDNKNVEIIANLGGTLIQLKRAEEAIKLYNNAVQIEPKNPAIHCLLGDALKLSNPLQALLHYQKAIRLQPQNVNYLRQYSEIFVLLPKLQSAEGLREDLIQFLNHEEINWAKLNTIVPNYLRGTTAVKQLFPQLKEGVEKNIDLSMDYGNILKAIADPVFVLAMSRMRILNPELEKLLETFRRITLIAISSNADLNIPLKDILKTLLIALSQFCFANEYVLNENDIERDHQANIIKNIADEVPSADDDFVLQFLILSCYQSAHSLPIVNKIRNDKRLSVPDEIKTIYVRQIVEPEIELGLREKVKQLTPIKDNISKSVQSMYEENPYPRWMKTVPGLETTYSRYLKKRVPDSMQAKIKLPENPEVLIAGSGTGRQPISSALTFTESNFTAVDLSVTSICYAMRKAKELEVKNIKFGQADIMELESLDKKFDIIECAGVLHHMKDPVAGWKILKNLLKKDGCMLIGLYSEIGRQDIVASRHFISEKNYSDDLDGIRKCRKAIMALDANHSTKRIVRYHDFYATSACRDLIFHIQEYRFSLPQIAKILDDLDMEFLCFVLDREDIIPNFQEMFPEDVNMTNLKNWHKFEETRVDSFATMYKFWIRKKAE